MHTTTEQRETTKPDCCMASATRNARGACSAVNIAKWMAGSLCLVLGFTSCDSRGPANPASSADVNAGGSPSAVNSSVTGNRQKQAAFLNGIRRADPDARTMDRALLNEQNELGLVLDRSVEMEKIPGLMKLMLTKMAAQFPGEDLNVIAYAPSNPPRKIGTARLDARTRDMTYTAE